MKFKTLLATLAISASILATSCGGSDDGDDSTVTFSGTALFKTNDGSGAPKNVKLVAVYFTSWGDYANSQIVSNIVDLGKTPNVDVPFSLDVDFSKEGKDAEIWLAFWIDTNDNGIFEASDEDLDAMPVYDECNVFGSAADADCFFDYKDGDGWIIHKDYKEISVFDATNTGAKIQSRYSFFE
ncbi:MAG: hypothetical protein KAZ87_09550 [Spirochaetes bacterium]|nr:hypothetical protein [Spirochaetota bacterium]